MAESKEIAKQEEVPQCCGACQKFLYEDMDGYGICDITGKSCRCSDGADCKTYIQEHEDSSLHCSMCALWNMGFDNSCIMRMTRFNDHTNQAPDQRACICFEKEEL